MKIFISGPDIFYKDGEKILSENKKLCGKYGFEGISPLDSGAESAEDIFKYDVKSLESADVIISNINSFRGETDPCTAFEIGMAYALGKKIYAYTSDIRSTVQKYAVKEENGKYFDSNSNEVENFGLPCNLMISVPAIIVEGDFEAALKKLAEDIK